MRKDEVSQNIKSNHIDVWVNKYIACHLVSGRVFWRRGTCICI